MILPFSRHGSNLLSTKIAGRIGLPRRALAGAQRDGDTMKLFRDASVGASLCALVFLAPGVGTAEAASPAAPGAASSVTQPGNRLTTAAVCITFEHIRGGAWATRTGGKMDAKTLQSIQGHIKDAEAKINELRADISTAKRAGLDVTDKEKQLTIFTGQLTLLKSAFNA